MPWNSLGQYINDQELDPGKSVTKDIATPIISSIAHREPSPLSKFNSLYKNTVTDPDRLEKLKAHLREAGIPEENAQELISHPKEEGLESPDISPEDLLFGLSKIPTAATGKVENLLEHYTKAGIDKVKNSAILEDLASSLPEKLAEERGSFSKRLVSQQAADRYLNALQKLGKDVYDPQKMSEALGLPNEPKALGFAHALTGELLGHGMMQKYGPIAKENEYALLDLVKKYRPNEMEVSPFVSIGSPEENLSAFNHVLLNASGNRELETIADMNGRYGAALSNNIPIGKRNLIEPKGTFINNNQSFPQAVATLLHEKGHVEHNTLSPSYTSLPYSLDPNYLNTSKNQIERLEKMAGAHHPTLTDLRGKPLTHYETNMLQDLMATGDIKPSNPKILEKHKENMPKIKSLLESYEPLKPNEIYLPDVD